MANNALPPILRQYDRLVAVFVLGILLVSLLWLVFTGLQQSRQVNNYDNTLELKRPAKSQVEPKDVAQDVKLIEAVATPARGSLLAIRAESESNLCTPARRLLCIKCARPIPWAAKACPFCKEAQPEEKKIDLSTVDSDGDGMPDVWEAKYGLNPQNANDADEDADADGFTNLEEFLAKTDPTDPKSHPGYETRMTLTGVEGKKVPLRAVNKMALPATKDAEGKDVQPFMVTFVSVSDNGEPGKTELRAKEGELIGKSGFRLVRYHDTPSKLITVNQNKHFINVSTVELLREADKKPATLVFWDSKNPDWPGEPLLEQKASINIDLPGIAPVVVAPGQTFKVKNESFTVLAVDAAKKSVRIQKNADKVSFELK